MSALTHTIHHSSTNPSISRVTFADATEDEAVHVKLYYGVPNRYLRLCRWKVRLAAC